MNLLKKERYFIVVFTAKKSYGDIINGQETRMTTNKYLNYKQLINDIKNSGDFNDVVINNIIKISKKEMKVWVR